MSARHEIRTTDDIMRLWRTLTPEKRELFMTDFRSWLALGEGLLDLLGPASAAVRSAFTWVDDGAADVLNVRIVYPNGDEQTFPPPETPSP